MTRATPALVDAFRKADFNVAAFVRDATGQGQDKVARLTQQLEDCAAAVEEDLQREIVQCHEELLQNAGSVNDLDGQLGDVREVVEALKTSIARVRADVLSPFGNLKRRTQLLERMQQVNVLIRKLLRFLFDARKLRTQMESPNKDYSKAAHTLRELELVLEESNLERVDALRDEVAWIRDCGAKVRKQAEDDLRSGIKTGNQISLNVALQVFFHLQTMWPQLKKLLAEMLDEFVQAPLPAGQTFHQHLEVNLQVLMAQAQKLHVLDDLVKSRTDPLTHVSFSSALEEVGVTSLTAFFWSRATSSFKTKVARVSQDRAPRKALLAEFPKVLHMITDSMDRVNLASRGRGQILKSPERDAMYATVADLRNEFLAEAVRRIMEPVEVMLPEKLLNSLSATGERTGASGNPADNNVADELPTSHDLKRYVSMLVAELERSECCPDLLLKEAVRNVRSSVLLFATKLEQVIDSSCVEMRCFEEGLPVRLRSPLPSIATGHARNARLFGIAHLVLGLLKDTVPARFQSVIVTQQVQTTLQQTQAAIIVPTLTTLQNAVQASAAQIEDGVKGRSDDGSTAFLAVQQACGHVARYYFALFGSGQLVPHVRELCAFILRAFLSAAVLAKPFTEQVRGALAQDMQIVETTLFALDSEYQVHVQHEVSIFKEFRKLIFSQSFADLDLNEIANVIPMHLVLAYLIHQLPEQAPSLIAASGSSLSQYLETTMLPLWDAGPDSSMALTFKSSVERILAAHPLGPENAAVTAFIKTNTGSVQ